MHADPCSSRRHDLRHFLERQARHVIKEHAELRFLIYKLKIHVRELSRTRDEHRDEPLFFALFIFPVVLQHAHPGDIVEHLLKALLIFDTGALFDLGKCPRLADPAEAQAQFCLLLGQKPRQHPVLRLVLCDRFKAKLVGDPVRDHFAEFCINRLKFMVFDPFRIISVRVVVKPFFTLRIQIVDSLHIFLLSSLAHNR